MGQARARPLDRPPVAASHAGGVRGSVRRSAAAQVPRFWFLAHRQWVAAVVVLVLAKLVGLGVTAFIFEVTKDKLLQMAWFRRVYAFFLWARDWAHEKVAPITRRLRKWRRLLQPPKGGRFFAHLLRVRRRMRAAAAS